MKRAFELIGVVDDVAIVLKKLERFLLKREAISDNTKTCDDADTFAEMAVGKTYGRYQEEITRSEIRSQGVPTWFDPREHYGQFGIINNDGLRCYIEVKIDEQKRSAPSTFDTEIMKLVIPNPEQASLFG